MDPLYPVSIEKLVFFFLGFVLWFSSVWWVSGDIRKKEGQYRNPWNTLLVFSGPLGALLYLSFNLAVILKKRYASRRQIVEPVPEEIHLFDHVGRSAYERRRFLFWSRRKVAGFDAAEEVKRFIEKAVEERATDVHLESSSGDIRSRFRIDGVLYDESRYSHSRGKMVAAVVKVLAGIDVAEKKKSQDGSFSADVKEHKIDFRVATSAAVHGESVAIRILDKSRDLISLEDLGLDGETLSRTSSFAAYPHGMVLASGPTGSGKTTTLYSLMQLINAREKNIVTIEDPIEYKLEGVTQMPVNPRAGVTFANGLRSILRQDPDIIMVGEIRDEETLKIATQAALTGHLVFSTIHANDAVSTIIRIRDMGVEPYLISASVAAIISQRLVRRLCRHCKKAPPTIPDFLLSEHLTLKEIYTAHGCRYCRGSGYHGRVGIFEVFKISERIRKMISENADIEELRKAAREEGMVTLKEDGIQKLRQGLTSPEELRGVASF